MRKVSDHERTISTQQASLVSLKKECSLLQESARLNETSSGKLQSVI
jgi:hypothetical protein